MTNRQIRDILRREFSVDIEMKQNELQEIEQRLVDVRSLLDRLRAVVIAQYYGAGTINFGELQDDREGLVRTSTRRKKANTESNQTNPEVRFTKTDQNGESPSHSAIPEETPSTASSSGRQSPVTDELVASSLFYSSQTKLHSQVAGASRLYIKKRVIVGNTSRFIPPEEREAGDQSTHKWMVYVRGVSEEPSVYHFISSVAFFLHPSYKPNDLVSIVRPPFHLTRRGWGEFPIRVQLHLRDGKKVDAIHNLKLDKTYSGLQTRGAETTVEVQVERHCVEPLSSLETSRITTAVPSPASDILGNQESDDNSEDDFDATADANIPNNTDDLTYYLPVNTQRAAEIVAFDHAYVSSNAISLTGLVPIDPETFVRKETSISLRCCGGYGRKLKRRAMLSTSPYPMPNTRDILKSMPATVKVFPTPERCLAACVKSFPLIHPNAAQLYPYAAVSHCQFQQWNISRQRAAEVMRAVALRKAVRSFFPSIPERRLPTTFQIVRWCRDNGHTSESVRLSAQESRIDLCRVCGWNLEESMVEQASAMLVHKECSERWCKKGRASVCSLTSAEEAFKGHLSFSHTVGPLAESMKVDICGDTVATPVREVPRIREEITADVQWVYGEAKKIGVELTEVEHDEVTQPTIEKMILSACCGLVRDILSGSVQQAALSSATQRLPTEITAAHVYQSILSNPLLDFLTNDGLGTSR